MDHQKCKFSEIFGFLLKYFNAFCDYFKSATFPLSTLSPDDPIAMHGSQLFKQLNNSWEPLITAALGYPQ